MLGASGNPTKLAVKLKSKCQFKSRLVGFPERFHKETGHYAALQPIVTRVELELDLVLERGVESNHPLSSQQIATSAAIIQHMPRGCNQGGISREFN